MEYKPYYAVHDFEDNIARKVLVEGFDVEKVELATRMYYCMKLIGEIDRLYKLQCTSNNEPTMYAIQNNIDRLNQAVKRLSLADIPGKPADFSENPIKDINNNTEHPFIKMLNKYKESGVPFESAVELVSGAAGQSSVTLTKWYGNNGICKETYIIDNGDAHKAGITAAKINACIDNMYEKAKPFLHDASSYLSFMKGFSEVSGIDENAWCNRVQDYVTQYSDSFDENIMSKISCLVKAVK